MVVTAPSAVRTHSDAATAIRRRATARSFCKRILAGRPRPPGGLFVQGPRPVSGVGWRNARPTSWTTSFRTCRFGNGCSACRFGCGICSPGTTTRAAQWRASWCGPSAGSSTSGRVMPASKAGADSPKRLREGGRVRRADVCAVWGAVASHRADRGADGDSADSEPPRTADDDPGPVAGSGATRGPSWRWRRPRRVRVVFVGGVAVACARRGCRRSVCSSGRGALRRTNGLPRRPAATCRGDLPGLMCPVPQPGSENRTYVTGGGEALIRPIVDGKLAFHGARRLDTLDVEEVLATIDPLLFLPPLRALAASAASAALAGRRTDQLPERRRSHRPRGLRIVSGACSATARRS